MHILIFLAGLNGAVAVALGAYGWHSLGDMPDVRAIFMMGSQYQMWHALAMLAACGLAIHAAQPRLLIIASIAFQVGIIFFSGTLYAFGALNIVPIEGAAPLGGMALIVGWLLLAIGGARRIRASA